MPVFSYTTIQSSTEGLYKEKGSKFIGFAYPVASEEEIKGKLNELKKKYFDASHHCFAFVLGADKSRYRAFDDGEPNHSAGDPILGQIKAKNLTHVLVVVVRYFGGTKLGVGGLISAYKEAAEEVLNKATLIQCEVMEKVKLKYEYSSTPEIMRLVKDFDLRILSQDFKDKCELIGEVRLQQGESFIEKVKLLNALGHTIALEL